MRIVLAVCALFCAGAAAAAAAEKFEDKKLGIAVMAPEGFTAVADIGKQEEFLGETKALYASPDVDSTAGILLIHHMDIPGGADYATLKGALSDQLKMAFGDKYRLIVQEDLKVEKLTGFVLEFECPGDGTKPRPGGNVLHHVRWYLIREGDAKLVGLIYTSRDSGWKPLDPKFVASAKTLKRVE